MRIGAVSTAGALPVGVSLAVAASLSYATTNIAIKVSNPWVSTWQSGFGRFLFGLAALPLLWRLFKCDLHWRDHGWLLLRSVTGVVSFMSMVIAFETISLSAGVILIYACPALCALVAPVMIGDRTPAGDWPWVLGAFSGVAVMLWPGWGGFEPRIGHLWALFSALTWAVTMAASRRVVRSNTPWAIYFQTCAVGVLVCGLPLAAQGQSPAPVGWQGWLGLGVTCLGAMISQIIMNLSLLHLPGHKVGVIMSMEVIIATLFGIAILGEEPSLRLVLGGVMIVGCGLVLNWRKGA